MSAIDKITDLEITEIGPFSNMSFQGITISWVSNIGFGECQFYKVNGENQWKVDTESMSSNDDKRFIKMILEKLADMVEVTG